MGERSAKDERFDPLVHDGVTNRAAGVDRRAADPEPIEHAARRAGGALTPADLDPRKSPEAAKQATVVRASEQHSVAALDDDAGAPHRARSVPAARLGMSIDRAVSRG